MDKRKAREIMREHQEGFVKLNPRWCAIEELISDSEKLEKIGHIIKTHDNDSCPEDYWYIDKIREILEGGGSKAMAEVVITEEVTENITHTVSTVKALKCDVCGKEFTGKYWDLTTQHSDWGNDSCESIENFDLCSKECVQKKLDEYFKECEDSNTQRFELEQDYFKEYRRG